MSRSRDNLFQSLLDACETNLQRHIILTQQEICRKMDRQKRDARKAEGSEYMDATDGGEVTV